MKVLFLGGDKRYLELIHYFINKNYDVHLLGYENIDLKVNTITYNTLSLESYDIILLPISGIENDYSIKCEFSDKKIILNPQLFNKIKRNSLVITGIRTKRLNELVNENNLIALMESNDIKKKNSIPTVEGIIADLILNTDTTINESNILIIGYGHVGKYLALKLKDLGSNVSICTLTFEDTKEVYDKDMTGFITNDYNSMVEALKSSNIIVNTVPSLIINEKLMNFINKEAYILDISSYPHGIDFNSANKLNIKNKLYLGIPAKVAPITAGQLLVDEIDSLLKRRIRG